MEKLDRCYEQYKNGEATLTETRNRLIGIVVESRMYFKLGKLSEDAFQDFLILFFPTIPSLLAHYDETKSSFSTFFSRCVSGSLNRYFRFYYENKAEKKAQAEIAAECARLDESLQDSVDVPPVLDPAPPREEILARLMQYKTLQKHRTLTMEQKLLILTLQSAHYLTAKHIHKISIVLGMDEKELAEQVTRLEEYLEGRVSMQRKQSERKNMAYLRKKKNTIGMDSLPQTALLYSSIRRAYEHRESSLAADKKPFCLYHCCPPNTVIAKMMGLHTAQVSHFLLDLEKEILLNGLCQNPDLE